MQRDKWMSLARELVECNGWDWEYVTKWYSFDTAYSEGNSAEWTANDCMEWLGA